MEHNTVTTNKEQGLYVISCDTGFSCLGFDVCLARAAAMAQWLDTPHTPRERGSIEAYEDYTTLVEWCRARYEKTGERCPTELTPQLNGLEGKRVEVLDAYDERRRFYVGKSTGWIPVHLEIARRDSSGGGAVTGAPFKSVQVIGTRWR